MITDTTLDLCEAVQFHGVHREDPQDEGSALVAFFSYPGKGGEIENKMFTREQLARIIDDKTQPRSHALTNLLNVALRAFGENPKRNFSYIAVHVRPPAP